MRRAIVYTVACIIAAFTIIVGCSSSAPSGQLSSPAPSTQPVAETRVYDIRDLIHQVPDYQNAPDFNITMANKPQSLFGGETPDSELWVVARGNDRVYPGSDDVTDFATARASATQPFEGQGFIQAPTPKIPIPGSGALMAKLPKEQRTMLIPSSIPTFARRSSATSPPSTSRSSIRIPTAKRSRRFMCSRCRRMLR